jgi:CheY-like chemotaxis protein
VRSSPPRVLVVDDDDLSRRALLRGLRGKGVDVVDAGTLAEAHAQLTDVDAILADVELADEDGLALLDAGTVPVIIASGDESRFEEARARGAVATFLKPVPLADLVTTLLRLTVGSSADGDHR